MVHVRTVVTVTAVANSPLRVNKCRTEIVTLLVQIANPFIDEKNS